MSDALPAEAPDVEAQVPAAEPSAALFGTFAGVYRPVFLTVLGALLYLREGWLVGNAGLGGAILIILAAYTITGTTALSVSSIATNLRLKAGGAFAIIAGALGLEAGGAIGVPLYIAQTISSVMYLYAFSEGYGFLFPTHDPRLVTAVAFLIVGGTVLRSAALASRAQAVMFGVVIVALLSAFGGWATATPQLPSLVGRFAEASPLTCFALFFPAATGIMVGAGMSGSLENPRESVPRGTMLAWGTTLVIYLLGAVWYATVVPRQELLTNNLAMVDHALFGPLVLFGLLSSTLMAALSSLVAAPRLLQAMAEHQVVPRSDLLQKLTPAGEPRNAILATLALAAVGLLAGSLDAIAPIITSFFIMTYLAVNVVVFLEQSLGLVSWRPTFPIRTAIPLVGTIACVLGLVLSSPAGGLPEVMFVVGIFVYLARRKRVDTPWETVQSGMAQSVAAWAALKASQMRRSPRTWKPDLLVPVREPEEARAMAHLARAIVEFRGSVKFVALTEDHALAESLDAIVAELRADEKFASWHLMPEEVPGQGARLSLSAMQGTFFAPNLLLLSDRTDPEVLQSICDHARAHRVGVVLAFDDRENPVGSPSSAAAWISDRAPDWELSLRVANLDLPVLLTYLLTWKRHGSIHLATVLRDPASRPDAQRFLSDLVELGRIPRATTHVLEGGLTENLAAIQGPEVHIFGLPEHLDLQRLAEIRRIAGVTTLFVQDSGQESALS
ncbi:MAG: amino acid permease [Myxococcota bacterium]